MQGLPARPSPRPSDARAANVPSPAARLRCSEPLSVPALLAPDGTPSQTKGRKYQLRHLSIPFLFLVIKATFVHTHAQKPTFLMSSLCYSSEFDLFLVHNLSVWVRISDVGADLNTRGPPPGHHPRFRGARYRGGPGGVRPGYPGGGGGLHPSQSSSSVISLGAHQGPFTYDVCKIL